MIIIRTDEVVVSTTATIFFNNFSVMDQFSRLGRGYCIMKCLFPTLSKRTYLQLFGRVAGTTGVVGAAALLPFANGGSRESVALSCKVELFITSNNLCDVKTESI